MSIQKDKVVILSYTLKVATGQVVDKATEDQPFAYIHGLGNALPAFEERLEGLAPGADFDFVLSVEDGYGEYEDGYVRDFDINMFKGEGVPPDLLTVGNIIPMQDQYGNPLEGEIVEITNEAVTLDFNHPLAGEELHFSGRILEVRDATNEELQHGHVHGRGGHHH